METFEIHHSEKKMLEELEEVRKNGRRVKSGMITPESIKDITYDLIDIVDTVTYWEVYARKHFKGIR